MCLCVLFCVFLFVLFFLLFFLLLFFFFFGGGGKIFLIGWEGGIFYILGVGLGYPVLIFNWGWWGIRFFQIDG